MTTFHSKAVPPDSMLPHVRAALEKVLTKFKKDPTYQVADSRTAELLLRQLAKQGLRVVPTGRLGELPDTKPLEEDTRKPRRITYTQREANNFLKKALAAAWPETPFFVRSGNGCTTVYYLVTDGGPAVDEVEALSLGYEGTNPVGEAGEETRWQPRRGEDGYPELVCYGTDYVSVAAVTTKGRVKKRKDGLLHISHVLPVSLRELLLR